MPTAALSSLERRIVGNLSIPRNRPDLERELLQDPVASIHITGNGKDIEPIDLGAHLEDLEAAGLLVRLGEHEDLAKLAASLERKKGPRAMPDEKAAIYVKRLAAPRRAWRAQGDLYIYTDEGHELLTGPTPGLEGAQPTTAELEATIAREAARVRRDLTVVDGQLAGAEAEYSPEVLRHVELANALLPDEFRAWQDQVIQAHEERTGERARPIIEGGSYGDATELLILAAETGGTAYGETSPTYGALTTVAVTDADTGTTITRATYTGYADKSIANADYNAPSAGNHTNANAITWAGATGGTSTCIGFGRVTVQGGGRLIRRAAIASVVVSGTNTPASIAAGSLQESLY
jgi:hypothetical protein